MDPSRGQIAKEKQHAVVREADFGGYGMGAATEQADVGHRVMRRTEDPMTALAPSAAPVHRQYRAYPSFQRILQRHQRQNQRHALGKYSVTRTCQHSPNSATIHSSE